MTFVYLILPFLPPLALIAVFLFSLPTGIQVMKEGNDADPLRKEIEAENKTKGQDAKGKKAA